MNFFILIYFLVVPNLRRGDAMLRSLINTFLGILTTSEVHELIDIFKGKGRRKITPYLEQYLASIDNDEFHDVDNSKQVLLQEGISFNTLKDASEKHEVNEGKELKGVLFILDSFRKTRKYQNLLKSREIINLYGLIKTQAITKSDELKSNQKVAKSKGVLVNKKHY